MESHLKHSRQHLLPTSTIRVSELRVSPVRSVRVLGVYIDADLSMHTHVTVSACFAPLRQIRSVWRSLSRRLVITCPLLLARWTTVTRKSQTPDRRPITASYECRRTSRNFGKEIRSHHSAAPRTIHWLKVPERIQFRLGVLTCRCLHNTAPSYLAESLHAGC